ncbi:SRPBCC family protein [Microbacterium sp. LWO12-1.2]|uniref:SRPBCC family protein n=1 Tax=Microbacterium sp. LWO12-1.2 TaxID=3135261 RepID=UPI00342ABD50
MSKLIRAAATSQTLSLAAMEEASRFGVRDADIEHLFLALTIDAGIGGQVLRSLGVTLDAARSAIETQQADQLGSLGVHADSAGGRIVYPETGGYDWAERALAVMRAAVSGDRDGDSAAVLRALLAEPSGLMTDLLERMDVEPERIVEALDDAAAMIAEHRRTAAERPTIHGTHTAFVPADPIDVWSLLADGERLAEWEPTIGEVVRRHAATGRWEARTRMVGSGGKPLKIRDGIRRQCAESVRSEQPSHITWHFTYPDEPRSNARVVAVDIEPAAAGAQLRLSFGWELNASRRRRRLIGALLKPVFRFLCFVQLTQIAGGISRAFR